MFKQFLFCRRTSSMAWVLPQEPPDHTEEYYNMSPINQMAMSSAADFIHSRVMTSEFVNGTGADSIIQRL